MLEDAPDRDRRHGLHVLIALLAAALAAPIPARLDATLSADGRTLTGTLVVPPGVSVVDPLDLPEPADDLNGTRTYPGAPDRGAVTFTETEPGVWAFTTRLPRRFGGVGATRWHGTFALGAFYPQPLVDGRPPVVDWTARVALPPGALGVLGDRVGEGELTWAGTGDRVVLAVPRRPRIVEADGLTLVSKGRARPALVREARAVAPLGPVVLVEAPLRRRLVRPAAGTAFVSDRAFRLFPPLRPYHRHGFVVGVAAAASGLPDPLARELVGADVGARWQAARGGRGAAGLTGAFAWIPTIDFLLSSRRMAFYSETLEEVLPSDPVRDDLFEVLAPYRPASMVAAQLDDRYGPGATGRVADGLRDGLTLPQALQLAGFDPRLAAHWRVPLPRQDYALQVGERAVVTRHVDGDAPPEVVVLRVDGRSVPVVLEAGGSVALDRPGRIAVDPGRHVQQTSRMGDAWPQQKLRVITSAGITSVNLTQFRISGTAAAWARGRYDTRNLVSGSLSTSPATLVSAGVGWTHKRGPLLDGISRPHRLSASVRASVIDPGFLSQEDGYLSVGGSVGWAWDTRVSSDFPQRGRRLTLGAGGGSFPGTASRWADLSAGATGLWSPHPRHVFAGRATAAIARSSRPDQLLDLAGPGAMRALPVLPPCPRDDVLCSPVATERAIGMVEYRIAPLRNLSVPMLLGWGTELQLTAGAEGMLARTPDGPAQALGATVGIAGIGDVFGAEPYMLGITAGWLLLENGLGHVQPLKPAPELYLRWSQAF